MPLPRQHSKRKLNYHSQKSLTKKRLGPLTHRCKPKYPPVRKVSTETRRKMSEAQHARWERANSIAERHLGLIAQRVYWHWPFLPQNTRNYYSTEDMIEDVVMYIFKHRRRYQRRLGAETTWVHHVAENRCKTIRYHLSRTLKRAACETVSLMPEMVEHRRAAEESRILEARNAVERVIQFSSDAVQDLIDHILGGHPPCEPQPEVVDEFRRVARTHGAGYNDFALVLKHCVE